MNIKIFQDYKLVYITIESSGDIEESKELLRMNLQEWDGLELCMLDIKSIPEISTRSLATLLLFSDDVKAFQTKIKVEVVNSSQYNKSLFELMHAEDYFRFGKTKDLQSYLEHHSRSSN